MAEVYTTQSGDTWDVIAKAVYGSEYHADIMGCDREKAV